MRFAELSNYTCQVLFKKKKKTGKKRKVMFSATFSAHPKPNLGCLNDSIAKTVEKGKMRVTELE